MKSEEHSLEDGDREKFWGIHAVKASHLKGKSLPSPQLHFMTEDREAKPTKLKKKKKSTIQEDITLSQDLFKNKGI